VKDSGLTLGGLEFSAASPAGARPSMKAVLRSEFAAGLREIWQFLEL
jgi:hypothetical protein